MKGKSNFWVRIRNFTLFFLIISVFPGGVITPHAFASSPVTQKAPNRVGTIDLNQIQILDLETAQKIALAANPSLAAVRERVLQAKERVAQAKSTYYPRIDALAVASQFWLPENDRQSALQAARLFNPNADLDKSDQRFTTGLAGSWILFDGFERKFSNSAAHFGEQESRESHMDARRLLLASVATAFFVAQLAREDIAIAAADETFNRRQAVEAAARLRVGTGSLSDVLNFEIQVNSARSRLIRAKRIYKVAMIGLATLLGIPEAAFPAHVELARLKPETKEELVAPSPAPFIDYAKSHRPDLLQGDYTVKRAESEVGVARAKFYPVINLTGTMDAERTGDAGFEQDDFGGSVGLNLTYNLFAGGLNRAQLAEAKSRLVEAEKNLDNTILQVASEVQESVAELIVAQEQLALQRKNATLVQQNRNLVEKEYNAGQASLVRLNEAQRDLTTAQSQLVLSLLTLRQSWESLKASTGEILVPFEVDAPILPKKKEQTDAESPNTLLYDSPPDQLTAGASDEDNPKSEKVETNFASQSESENVPKESLNDPRTQTPRLSGFEKQAVQLLATPLYTIHLESFRNSNRARNRVEYYQSLGLEAFSRRVDLTQKGVFYRVLVGHFPDKQQAREFQTRLEKEYNLKKGLILVTSANAP